LNNTKLTTLENGLRVVTRSIESFESVALGYWINVGGVYENSSNCGISHFLEHMAFKGTTSRTAKQIADEIESVGGYLNAYTSKETTAYHAKLLKGDINIAIEILSDILQNPTFLANELEREREVILQEIYQTQDSPDDIIFDYFQSVAFSGQSMGYPILGPSDVVSKITSDDLRAYALKHYNANNMIFSAVGNISHEELIKAADKYFHNFRTNSESACNISYEYVGGTYSDVRELEQVHTIVGFNGVANTTKEYYTASILSSILGGGMASRLFQEIREKRGLAYSIYSFSSSYRKNGVFGIYSATTEDRLPELADVLSNELLKVKENIFEKEFNRTKAQFRASLLMAGENNSASCEQIVNQTFIFGEPLKHSNMLEKLNSITIDDVKKLAEKIFSTVASVVTVGKCDCSCVVSMLNKNGFKVA
jgi:predicted Zn-dependent peptidase